MELIDGLEEGGLDEYGNPLKKNPKFPSIPRAISLIYAVGHMLKFPSILTHRPLSYVVAGAYWRGDEKPHAPAHLWYGWNNPDELKDYIWKWKKPKRDHRKIGRDWIFQRGDEVGEGFNLWHPKGGKIRKLIEDFWRGT